MEISYTHKEYRELAKEVCFIVNDIRQLSDIICSAELFSDVNTQANATCRAISLVDQLKNYLVQMNFLTCNAASNLVRGGDNNVGLIERGTVDNSNNDDTHIGNTVELHSSENGSEQLLENSKTGNVEEGNKEDTEVLI